MNSRREQKHRISRANISVLGGRKPERPIYTNDFWDIANMIYASFMIGLEQDLELSYPMIVFFNY